MRPNGEQRVLGFWRRNLRLYKTADQILFLLHFTHGDIYQYVSPKPERSFCTFGKRENSLISLFKGVPTQATNYYFHIPVFILCCTSENV